MRRIVHPYHQGGTIIVTVALALLFLLGFMGISLDLAHLFIVKTELQTAMDSCALSAAQELDGMSGAMVRAKNSGKTAGNLNRVDLQSATWNGQGMITDADISFRDAAYQPTNADSTARYAQCQRTQTGVRMWLLHAMGAFAGTPATYPNTGNVLALAVATRASAQSTCPLPVGLKPKDGGTAPNYGFQVGEWVTVYGDKAPGSGEMGWYNLDGSTSANELKKELTEGYCGTRLGDTLGTPGAKTTANVPWNYRFGIYKNNDPGPGVNRPDFSGYSYTATNWKNTAPQSAFDGTPAAGSDPSAANYRAKRAEFASFDDTGTSLTHGSQIVFGQPNQLNSFKDLATPGSGGQHQQYGYSRRLVTIPVLNAGNQVIDYACMFMLHPMSGPQDDVQLEFRGNSGAMNSPCTTNGMPGGTTGPQVSALVR